MEWLKKRVNILPERIKQLSSIFSIITRKNHFRRNFFQVASKASGKHASVQHFRCRQWGLSVPANPQKIMQLPFASFDIAFCLRLFKTQDKRKSAIKHILIPSVLLCAGVDRHELWKTRWEHMNFVPASPTEFLRVHAFSFSAGDVIAAGATRRPLPLTHLPYNPECIPLFQSCVRISPISPSMQMDCFSISPGHTACPWLIQA